MFGLDNPTHILFLLAALLVVFGAKRLPELGRSLGVGMRGFRNGLSGIEGGPDTHGTTSPPAPGGPRVAEPARAARR
jgi:sec-independent protein translocase protein TatA